MLIFQSETEGYFKISYLWFFQRIRLFANKAFIRDMKINVNNITLNYIKEGSGKPLILLHGNGEDHHIFDKLVEKLKNDYSVYAIDSRNHGESSKTNDFSYGIMSKDVLKFIKELGLEEVSIIGFSDGAIVSVLLALEYTDLFDKMVILGVNLKPSDFKKEIHDYLINEYERTQDPLVHMMLEQPDIELGDLQKIQTPTMVIGAEDDLYYEKSFENIANTIPNAELRIMQGHDHGSYIINQDILYPVLKAFL